MKSTTENGEAMKGITYIITTPEGIPMQLPNTTTDVNAMKILIAHSRLSSGEYKLWEMDPNWNRAGMGEVTATAENGVFTPEGIATMLEQTVLHLRCSYFVLVQPGITKSNAHVSQCEVVHGIIRATL